MEFVWDGVPLPFWNPFLLHYLTELTYCELNNGDIGSTGNAIRRPHGVESCERGRFRASSPDSPDARLKIRAELGTLPTLTESEKLVSAE